MIPTQNLVAWGQVVLWSEQRQVEQNLLFCCAIVVTLPRRGRLDSTHPRSTLPIMPLSRDKARYRLQLQKNPQQAAPALSTKRLTVARLHRYKDALRAFDAARLELKLASPAKIQRENSAVGTALHSRILRFSQHA